MKRIVGLVALVALVALLIAPAMGAEQDAVEWDPCKWCGTVPGWCWLCLHEIAWEGDWPWDPQDW